MASLNIIGDKYCIEVLKTDKKQGTFYLLILDNTNPDNYRIVPCHKSETHDAIIKRFESYPDNPVSNCFKLSEIEFLKEIKLVFQDSGLHSIFAMWNEGFLSTKMYNFLAKLRVNTAKNLTAEIRAAFDEANFNDDQLAQINTTASLLNKGNVTKMLQSDDNPLSEIRLLRNKVQQRLKASQAVQQTVTVEVKKVK